MPEDCRKNHYCEAIYDKNGCKLVGVRDPRKFASIINRLVAHLGHLKLTEITVRDLQNYRTMRLKTETGRGELTDVATVNRELSTCRLMLNDAVTNDWALRRVVRAGSRAQSARRGKLDQGISAECVSSRRGCEYKSGCE